MLAATALLLGLVVMHGLGVGHGREILHAVDGISAGATPTTAHAEQAAAGTTTRNAGHMERAGLTRHAGHTERAGHSGPLRAPRSAHAQAAEVVAAVSPSASPTAPDSHGVLGMHALMTCLAILPGLLLAFGAALWRRLARRLPTLRALARWCVAAPVQPTAGHRLKPSLHELCVLRT